ncbi:response regulator transcription factor [Candidatus Peribacteria bacterium]|nr:response regulator transcription factor [Candidatus Peribacteria bacterium]
MRVLLVEDEKPVREMIASVLDESNFTVDETDNGQTALQMVQKTEYDCLILDLKIPGMTGMQLIASMRTIGIQTPVLVISSLGQIDNRVRALDMGADDFLVKDFDMQELIARVKAVSRRKSSNRRNILKCRDVMIDTSTMEVQRQGKEILLTKTELKLLIILLEHKGSVVTRDMLLEKVWGRKRTEVQSNSIDVHIKSLRKAIDKPFSGEPLVETVRGYGYIVRE